MSKNKKSKINKPELNLNDKTKQHIVGIIFIAFTAFSALALFGFGGTIGGLLAKFLYILLGNLAYLGPLILTVITIACFKPISSESYSQNRITFGLPLFVLSLASLIHLYYLSGSDFTESAFTAALEGKAGGLLGAGLAFIFLKGFGVIASFITSLAIMIISLLMIFDFHLRLPEIKPRTKISNNWSTDEDTEEEDVEEKIEKKQNIKIKPVEPIIKVEEEFKTTEAATPHIIEGKNWKLPPLNLLEDNKSSVDSGDISNNEEIIKKTLKNFGVNVEMAEVKVGPTVTQYSFAPNAGVRLNSIKSLQHDLALALSAPSLRMELPIPGKALVGIEIPNRKKAMVKLKQVMENDGYNKKLPLQFAIGLDVAGQDFFANLADLPHLLIAGASGKGKSVAINSLITSLLYKNSPETLKLVIIDPKKVEMGLYNGIPHLEAPVIIDKDKASNSLAWACKEMDRRYNLLSEAHKRNLTEYNEVAPVKLPYLVIIIDELADLMLTSNIRQEVETSIIRISQLGRACGIHMIVATQNPKAEVVTGLIKANITARMAFAVASNNNSRVILDEGGAEELLGNGDMLFTSTDLSKPIRLQGAFISSKEVKKVCDFLRNQAGAVIYNDDVIDSGKKGIMQSPDDPSVEDEMYEAAKDIVLRERKASTSYLQRRLKVGYNRAANLIEMLEEHGVIGAQHGSTPREILMDSPIDDLNEENI